jgi:uncharacterized protein (TIGR00369 family)
MDLGILKQVVEELIPFNKFLGIRVAQMERGNVTLEIPYRAELVGDQLRPALHGGVLSALADTAGGFAVWSAVEDPMARVSTIDLRVDYLRPARLELLAATATVARVGGRVGVVDIVLFHPADPGHTVATGKGVYAIKIPKGARAAPPVE